MPPVHPFDLTGRRALVTGAGSGLGLAIAHGLANAGASIIVNGRKADKVRRAVDALLAGGASAHPLIFDVTQPEAVAEALDAIEQTLGPVDILVNNAGVNQRAPLESFSEADWRKLLSANLDGPFHVTRSLIPAMKARRRGKIINICSLASDIGRPNIVPYATSKGGLKMFTRALAVELAPHNIQVNGITPGFFRTEMNAPLVEDREFSAWVARRTPAGRWGEPAEVAGAAVFLASDAADYVTGHLLAVDGGFGAAY
ncbi:MAG: glucose 1-dehydrogenase [Betaproteobacteria bacterium]|nr:MAG: glucose 1-dehydrogenase [Betaproteobacteria bacterium]